MLDDVDTVFGFGLDRGAGTASAELRGSLSLASPATGGATVTVTTPVAFVDAASDTRRFPIGTLRIEAGDGSRIELEADNGDPDTFEVALTAGGIIERFAEPWAEWTPRLRFD